MPPATLLGSVALAGGIGQGPIGNPTYPTKSLIEHLPHAGCQKDPRWYFHVFPLQKGRTRVRYKMVWGGFFVAEIGLGPPFL